jgi:hypothetical protein
MTRAWLCFLAALMTAASVTADDLVLPDDVLAHIEEIRARDPELREDSFSKMGGSSVASTAFLNCFATEYVDLGERSELQETIEFFGTERGNPFRRKSEAAGVSWNLRYVLGGKPANFREELRATNARWALVLFGSNDAQNENEQVYLERLVYLVEEMTELGVVPILGSALPRRNSYRNRWIDRFNLITEAVATHWSLPYIDYNAALTALPRRGLARDGVHPNVLPPGGLANACVFTEKGLQYGNNVRNLLTLQMLAELRDRFDLGDPTALDAEAEPAVVIDTDREAAGVEPKTHPAPEEPERHQASFSALLDYGPDPEPGAELAAEPTADFGFDPISLLLDKTSLPEASPLPRYCGTTKPGSRHFTASFTVAEPTRIRVSALDLGGRRPRVLLVRREAGDVPARCVRRRLQTLEVDVPVGMWDLVIEVPKAAAEDGKLLLLATPEPR